MTHTDPGPAPGLPAPLPPQCVARDTWLVRELRAGPGGVVFHANSLVIRGREPVLVDTGTAGGRERWLADVSAVVDPADVRWIFLSHDDRDHAGNLAPLLDACPDATVVTTRTAVERLDGEVDVPEARRRYVDHGESFDAGDRTLVALTPPLFDAPATRGLYDARTAVYWAADCFRLPPGPAVDDCRELDPAAWRAGLRLGAAATGPWPQWLDARRWAAYVDRIERLGIAALAGAHCPVVTGGLVAEAFTVLRALPGDDG